MRNPPRSFTLSLAHQTLFYNVLSSIGRWNPTSLTQVVELNRAHYAKFIDYFAGHIQRCSGKQQQQANRRTNHGKDME